MDLNTLLSLLLLLISLKIAAKILANRKNLELKEIKANKMKFGVISRKDFASFESCAKIKNKFLYNLANSNHLPIGVIPYRFVFDDNTPSELDEFIEWCKRYLKKIGFIYSGVLTRETFIPDEEKVTKITGNVAILSLTEINSNKKVYAKCVLLRPNILAALEDIWPKLGRPEVQKFVGLMAGDHINTGIILTTGDFSEYAKEYASTLASPYSLQLIEGKDLASLHRQIVGI